MKSSYKRKVSKRDKNSDRKKLISFPFADDIDFDDLDAFDEEVDLFRSKYDRNSGKDENENLDPAIDPATAEKVREKERLAIGLKAELLAKIRELGKRLPTNT